MQTPGRSAREIILLLAVFIILTGCKPDKYSGGRGSRIDPYKIADADDLLELAAETNDYGAHYILTADIDLGSNVPGGQVFNTAVIARDINNSGCDFDGIVFTGKSPKPVFLWVHDGQAELRDASHLWGKITGDTQEAIRAELGI